MNQTEERKQTNIPKIQPVKFIERTNGTVKGYAVNTFHGLVKNYNEDRVSIIMNITKPNFKGRWPRCSYFGVFDGHGGNKCSDFLKQNMHRYITENSHFPHQPIQALKFGFKKAQQQFLRYAESQNPVQRSGSCAIVLLIIDEICYVANVGDSRAILSASMGKNVYAISKDHKPDSDTQKQRIYNGGGKIYQSSIKNKNGATILGPFRIQPGKLSVSRSFGDIEAKHTSFGGNPKVLIAKPQITYFQINNQEHDFVMLCSDGVYDKLANEEVSTCFWNERQKNTNIDDIKQKYQFIGNVPSKVIERSMQKMSMDNLTCLIIVFQDNGRLLLPSKKFSRVSQKQIVRRPQSSIDFQGQNKKSFNHTNKTQQRINQDIKTLRMSKQEQAQTYNQQNRSISHNKQNKQNHKDNEDKGRDSARQHKQGTFKQMKQNVDRMAKRKSSANLIQLQKRFEDIHHGSNSLTSSISAKMLIAGSKAQLKSKQKEGYMPQKLSLNDMNKNRKNVDNFKKDGKDSLWKLLANQKSTDPQEKLIRF